MVDVRPLAILVALLAIPLLAGCTSLRAAVPAESYQRATAILSGVPNTPDLVDTFHTDPRVLSAIGEFLGGAEAEHLAVERMPEQFARLVPSPPWEWSPAIEFRRIRPRLYLVALSQAFMGPPGSLYVFDGASHVTIDPAASGVAQVDAVHVDGDRIEVAYFPTRSGGRPRLTSILLVKDGQTWRVDRDTPYARVAAMLAQVPRSEMSSPGVHRNAALLDAVGVFLANAGRLDDADLERHMISIFPVEWYRAWPRFDMRRISSTLYLVTIEHPDGDPQGGSLYLFDGGSYVRLASDDTRSIDIEKAEVSDRRVEVKYSRRSWTSRDLGTAVAEKHGQVWRLVQAE